MRKLNLFTLFVLFAAIIYSCNSDSLDNLKVDNVTKTSNQDAKNSAKNPDGTDSVDDFTYINSTDPAFNDFLNSNTYQNHSAYINDLGDMDLSSILHQKYEVEGQDYDYFVVTLFKNGELKGKLEILDLNDTPFLPNNDKYALNYADLSSYDMAQDTGTIKLYDLNYENFLHTTMEIANGYYVNVEGNGLSNDLAQQYAYLSNPAKNDNLAGHHLCDTNGNGNISFSECYNCIVKAIKQNATSTAICQTYKSMGLPWWGSCGASVVLSCVVISSIY